VWVCVSVRECAWVCVSVRVWVCVSVCECVWVCVSVCECVWVCVSVCECVCVCVSVCECEWELPVVKASFFLKLCLLGYKLTLFSNTNIVSAASLKIKGTLLKLLFFINLLRTQPLRSKNQMKFCHQQFCYPNHYCVVLVRVTNPFPIVWEFNPWITHWIIMFLQSLSKQHVAKQLYCSCSVLVGILFLTPNNCMLH